MSAEVGASPSPPHVFCTVFPAAAETSLCTVAGIERPSGATCEEEEEGDEEEEEEEEEEHVSMHVP